MKLRDRCRVPGCLLDYGGKACKEARKKHCPDVVFTNADKIREMDDEALAVAIACPHDDDKCPGPGNAKTCMGNGFCPYSTLENLKSNWRVLDLHETENK